VRATLQKRTNKSERIQGRPTSTHLKYTHEFERNYDVAESTLNTETGVQQVKVPPQRHIDRRTTCMLCTCDPTRTDEKMNRYRTTPALRDHLERTHRFKDNENDCDGIVHITATTDQPSEHFHPKLRPSRCVLCKKNPLIIDSAMPQRMSRTVLEDIWQESMAAATNRTKGIYSYTSAQLPIS
jgi:hypothetical protein